MKNKVSEITIIHPNFTNYFYEINTNGAEKDRFLLFNPSINYWIATDEIGGSLIQEMAGKDIGSIRKSVMQRYVIDGATFDQDVLPFIENLIEMHFFTLEKTPPHASWVPDNFSLRSPKQYPFNDIYISLEDTCTLDCSYCFNKDDRMRRLRHRSAPSMSDQMIIKVMNEFKELGGKGVCFTGGEPTLHPSLLDFCEEAKAIGLTTHFITNGTRLKNLDAKRLVQWVDSVAVSVDTLENAVASCLWGTTRYRIREDIILPIKNIADMAKPMGKTLGIIVKPTVTALNLESLQPMVEEVSVFLAGCNLSWDFTRYEPIDKSEIDRTLSITEEAYNKKIYACIDTLCHITSPASWRVDPPECYNMEKAVQSYVLSQGGKFLPQREPKLLSCAPSFFVTNTGEVYPCQGLELDEFCLGTVWNRTIREMFDDAAFANLRTKMTVDDIEVCKDCELRYTCTKHCHGHAQKAYGRTTAFTHGENETCRAQTIKRLWLETQVYKSRKL